MGVPARAKRGRHPPKLRGEALARKVVALRAEHPDWSHPAIADAVGCSRRNVCSILNKAGFTGRAVRPPAAPKEAKDRRRRHPPEPLAGPLTGDALAAGVAVVEAHEVGGLVPDPGPLLERIKRRLAEHPATADPMHLPNRLRRLIDRCVDEIEAALRYGTLRDKVGALKYATECYIAVTAWDRGIMPAGGSKSLSMASTAIQVNVGSHNEDGRPFVVPAIANADRDGRLNRLAERMERLGLKIVVDAPLSAPKIVDVGEHEQDAAH